jgi:YcxB-like protein
MVHAFLAVLLTFLAFTARSDTFTVTPLRALYALLAVAAMEAFFIGFPQLAFKPQIRTFTVTETGIETKIGRRSGSVNWSQIKSIEDSQGEILISRRNGNAFLIPERAFRTQGERADFFSKINSWHTLACQSLSK